MIRAALLSRAALAAAAVALSLGGCKKHVPPPMQRLWLAPSYGFVLSQSGDLISWGDNASGQLGDGTTTSQPLPGVVRGAARPRELALGDHHACGIFDGGHVRCWGEGRHGELGDGAKRSRTKPGDVLLEGKPLVATAIAAAGDRTCAVTAAGARCWGGGHATPFTPPALRGVTVSGVALGGAHACAIASAPREVRCFGKDDRGQSARLTPVLRGREVSRLTAGARHTCALLSDGTVQCWGGNDLGQLGDGTKNDSPAPVRVHGLAGAKDVRAGARHTCALLRDGTVSCWGDDRFHQLADSASRPSSRPVPLFGLVSVLEIAAGGDGTCARLRDGEVRCWGRDDRGQLGDGRKVDHDVPMPLRWR